MEANVNKGFALLFEMGCGKTLTAIAIAGAAYKGGYVKKVLVIAPTSVVAVWPKELEEFADFPFTVQTLLGDKRKRLKAISDLERYRSPKLKAAPGRAAHTGLRVPGGDAGGRIRHRGIHGAG